MQCPNCGQELQSGTAELRTGDFRTPTLCFFAEDTKPGLVDRLLRTGQNAAPVKGAHPALRCLSCQKTVVVFDEMKGFRDE